MAPDPAGRGAPHAQLGPRRLLALPQPQPARSGHPPARLRVRAAPVAAARGPRRAGGGAAGSATCWRRRGAEGTALGTVRGRPLPVPRAPLGTGDSASPPSSRGLQQLPPGPRLVRWARERRRAGGRSSPRACPGRARAPPAARSLARARPRPVPPPPLPRTRAGDPAGGACRDRGERARGRPDSGRGWRRRAGSSPGGRGQARQPGTPDAQVPFGGKAQTRSRAPTGHR